MARVLASWRRFRSPPQRSAGFTLIELMVTVVVLGIITAIAVPNYFEFVRRGKIIDATSKLGNLRSQMEKYFLDFRTYDNGGACGYDPVANGYNADPARQFDFTCGPVTATTYTITATGLAPKGMGGFTYTINQLDAKASVGPAGTFTNPNCWAIRKDGTC